MEKKYFLPDIETDFSFEQIVEMILAGTLVRKSIVWEESLKDWTPLDEIPEFNAVFEESEKIAEEQLKKALGIDEESIEKREMKKILATYEGDSITMESSSFLKKGLIFIAILAIISLSYFVFLNKKDEKTDSLVKETQKTEKINIDDLKFSSGVNKIESIKEIKIKKITTSEEDKILAEALLALKKEKSLETQPQNENSVKSENKEISETKKAPSLFDKVSDEELRAFRKKLLSQGVASKTTTTASLDSLNSDSGEKLSDKQISEVINANSQTTVKYCYNQALKIDASLRGRMEVTLHILGNGNVAKVVTETEKFKNTEMERCLDSQIKKKWKFPPFNGTITTVQIPFILSAN